MSASNASITLDDSIFGYESEVFLNSVSSSSSNEKPTKSRKKEKKDQENLRKLILKISEEGVFTEDDLYDAEAEIKRTRKLVLGQKSVQFEEMKERHRLMEIAGLVGEDDETIKIWAQRLKDFTAREITRDELLRVATMLRDNPDAISTLPNTAAEIKPTDFKKTVKAKPTRISLIPQEKINKTTKDGRRKQCFCSRFAFLNKIHFKNILWISVGIIVISGISCGIYFAVESGKTTTSRATTTTITRTTTTTNTRTTTTTSTRTTTTTNAPTTTTTTTRTTTTPDTQTTTSAATTVTHADFKVVPEFTLE